MLTISEMKEKVGHLNSKLEVRTKYGRMLNSRMENLKEILGVGKLSKDMKRIGYNDEPFNSKNMFVTHIQKT